MYISEKGNQMKKWKALITQQNEFGLGLSGLLLLKIFFYDWFDLWCMLDGLGLFLWGLLCIVWILCLDFVVYSIFTRIRRKKFDKIFLCVLLLFLPLTDAYESMRFLCLRPIMEKAAVETAQRYQAADVELIDGVFNVALPFPYSLIGRSRSVDLVFDNDTGIRVVFLHHWTTPFSSTSEYIYQTNVPYIGLSDDWKPYPDPETSVFVQKEIYSGWEQVITENGLVTAARKGM